MFSDHILLFDSNSFYLFFKSRVSLENVYLSVMCELIVTGSHFLVKSWVLVAVRCALNALFRDAFGVSRVSRFLFFIVAGRVFRVRGGGLASALIVVCHLIKDIKDIEVLSFKVNALFL